MTPPSARRRWLVGSLLVVAAAAAVASHLARRGPAPGLDAAEAWPRGRWHRQPAPPGTDPDELARLLSLPYAAGRRAATGRPAGVVRHDPQRAYPGVNLYTSGHAPEAILLDLDGRLLHRWSVAFEDAFPDRRPTSETAFLRTAALLPDGDLLALYQGGGLARLDRRSRIVWTLPIGLYNDVFVEPGGAIWCLAKEAIREPELAADAAVLEDSVVAVGPDGAIRHRFSLLAALRGSPFWRELQEAGGGDILHANAVRVLDDSLASAGPAFAAGNLLVSLRQLDLLVVLDRQTGRLLASLRGPWRRQHDPRPLPGGRLLLFDNRGLGARSRALELTVASGDVAWEWAGEAGAPLASPEAGSAQRLPNGNTLITDSEQGRAVEVAPDGAVVWELVSPHRAGPHRELVATLFEVRRLPRPDWLPASAATPAPGRP